MLHAGQIDGYFFGLLAFGNTINNGRKTRADGKGPPPRAYKLRVGAINFGVRSVHEHSSPGWYDGNVIFALDFAWI